MSTKNDPPVSPTVKIKPVSDKLKNLVKSEYRKIYHAYQAQKAQSIKVLDNLEY